MYGPMYPTPGNECFMAASEYKRQIGHGAHVASWEHTWIDPNTGKEL